MGGRLEALTARAATALFGQNPTVDQLAGLFQQALLYAPSKRIAGGTDEILRNIIAERVLGLPADIRADKGLAFNQIPTSRR